MIHAREDYQRIQDPDNKIPEDEPVFLIRGQDKAAASTVRHYADILEAQGGAPEMVQTCRAHADLIEEYPAKKLADM